MKHSLFTKSLEEAVSRFHSWNKDKPIRIISHLDADGISACAILTHVMNSENRSYTINILPQLSEEGLLEIAKEENKYIIFADLGSGQLSAINRLLDDKEIIILDHHDIEKIESKKNIVHINPHLHGIDGSKEISGAGVCYFFAKALDKKYEELAHIAILGAIGDIQEDNGFMRLNDEILIKALENGTVVRKRSLKFFGAQTRPLHKVLEYCTDPFIPGVSGSESGAVQFIQECGINIKKGSKWKTLSMLNDEEVKRLVTGIVMRRMGDLKPDDILGYCYTFPHEKEGTSLYDAREFATVLNACGRMERAGLGIGACLNSKQDKRNALKTLSDYKREIVRAIEWYKGGDRNECIIKGENFLILNAKDEVKATVIGTLASIISKSNFVKDHTYIMSLARNKRDSTKISLRIKGGREDIDLRDILKEITSRAGGEFGGHMRAAGAVIPTENEDKFIETAKTILETTSIQ